MSFFVIPNYVRNAEHNRWMLTQCLKSIREHEKKATVLVVDDGSPEIDRDFYKFAVDYGVLVAMLEVNGGYSATINYGLRFAVKNGADLICTLNNDVEIYTPIFERPRQLLHEMPRLGIVGAKLYFPGGQVQHGGLMVAEDGSIDMLGRNALGMINPGDTNRPKFVAAVTGALQVINAEMLKETGLYSPKYKMAYEDVEFCLRAWDKGWHCLYDPYIEAIHYEGATRGKGLTKTEAQSLGQYYSDFRKLDYHAIRQEMAAANALLEKLR